MPDKEKILGMLVNLPYKDWLEIRTTVDALYEKASESVCLTESDAEDATTPDHLEAALIAKRDKLQEVFESELRTP